jgi:hypothetical protein
MSKVLSLIAGVSALALAGTANAGGPVSLTNAQMDVVTAGGSSSNSLANLSSTSTNNVNFTGNSKINDTFNKTANINVKSYVIGNSASLGFDNEAVGKNSNVQGTFSQETVAGQGSSQSGLFVSAANGRVYTPMYSSKY